MKNRCKIHLPKTEYVKMAQRLLDIKLRKKFQGMEFRVFYEFAAKVTKYEELLNEESQRRKSSTRTYCKEVNCEEMAVADLLSIGSFICPLLMNKVPNLWKKSQTSNTQLHYTFDAKISYRRRNSSHFP